MLAIQRCLPMRYVVLSSMMLLLFLPLVAQRQTPNVDVRIEAMQKERIDFFAKELQLTESEKIFLDKILKESDEKHMLLLREVHHKHHELTSKIAIPRVEFDDYLQLCNQNKKLQADLEKETMEKLATKIAPEKLIKFESIKRRFIKGFYTKHHKDARKKKGDSGRKLN